MDGTQVEKKKSKIERLFEANLFLVLPYILLFLVLAVMGLTLPYFFTYRNLMNILRQASSLAIMAMGVTIVLITGGMDISIPAIMAFSGILGSMYIVQGGSILLGVLIMLGVATFLGAVNGMAIAYLRMVPFVVTLSMQAIATGASVWMTRNISISGLPDSYVNVIAGRTFGIPNSIIYVLIIGFIFWVIMKKAVPGRWLFSVGTNVRTSKVSGIPGDAVIFFTYVVSGFMAGVAAIFITARLESASPTMGEEGVVLNVIGAAVIGGASIYGGIGTSLGAIFGAIIMTLITNGMNMMHISYHSTLIVKGFVIIFFVAFDSLKRATKAVRI